MSMRASRPSSPDQQVGLSPGKIVSVYAIFSILWISYSDRIVNRVGDARLRLVLNTGKGILFVLVTAALLYYLVRRLVMQMRRAQESLAAREAEYRALILATAEGICRLDCNGCIVFANPRMAEMLQSAVEELPGRPLLPFLNSGDAADFSGQLELWRQGNAGQRDLRFRGAKGAEVFAIITGTAIGADCVLMVMDVTERQRLQEQLHHAQRLETVGRLAGGIAHDFNNLLGVIIGYTTLLGARAGELGPAREHIAAILRASETAAALVRQLLTFSRKQPFRETVVDLNEVAADVAHMLPRLITEEVKVVIHTDEQPANIKTDPAQIHQLIINLAVNARDAMPHGGTLNIETFRLDQDAGSADGVPPGKYAVLRVSDNGIGMDPETRAQIFEPFFTTKEVGKGTGLGLSMVYGIVKQSGGQISVTSEQGNGTSFTIRFPRVEGTVSARSTPQPTQPERCNHETILLVEDEEQLRVMTRDLLTGEGYEVMVASDGREALAIAEQDMEKIDLLLTDVVMPRMGGHLLAQKLVAMKPELKVIFVSGYAAEAMTQPAEFKFAVIEKPISPAALVIAVGKMLDGA